MLAAHSQAQPLPAPPYPDPLLDPTYAVPRTALFLDHIAHLVDVSVSPAASDTVEDDGPASPSGPNYSYAPRDSRSPSDLYGNPATYPTPYPYSPQLTQDPAGRFLYAPISPYPNATRLESLSDRQPRYGLLPKISTSQILDQRRMSEPAVSYMPPAAAAQNTNRQQYPLGSLRDPRHDYSPVLPPVNWKQDPEEHRRPHDVALGQYGVHGEDNYGPSPPGTGTSSSSTAPATLPAGQSSSPDSGNKRTYSFVALPGNAVRKRPRRRYDEIERLYHCSWPECNKAYGTLNHLNAHVQMQKHGAKRSPNEFKELRKQWRKAKKEYESPGLGPVRRSMSLRREQHDLYHAHPYSSPTRAYQHSTALSPPLAVSIPHLRPEGSYMADSLRYPAESGEDVDPHAYGGALDFRQQQQSPWHALPARAEMYPTQQPAYPYLDSHAQMMESVPAAHPYAAPQRNRLPPDSMLLTPLVASGASGEGYTEGYYEDKARGGHPTPSLDPGSGDEY
ncbi:hypothetical protein B0H10DRAFT_2241248 [Mycena sp. CBHHK59/15]|nr:hypothetical protein B0H10DRAFT_2241248 [Mycena sp. CBHHK59/15]